MRLCAAALALWCLGCPGGERAAPPGDVPAPGKDRPLLRAAPRPAAPDEDTPVEALRVVGTDLSSHAVEALLGEAVVERLRPLGPSALRFEMRLAGPVDALWIPADTAHPRRWAREVAAWRVAGCAGVDIVPPAAVRRLSRDEVRARLHRDYVTDWEEVERRIAWDADGIAAGAAVLLVRDMRPSGLGRGRRLERRLERLRQATAGEGSLGPLERDLAKTLLYDYLIGWAGRFDRPLQALPGAERLLLLDHGEAFAVDPPAELRHRMISAERFPETLLEGLSRCDAPRLRRSLRDGQEPLLEPAAIEAVVERRETVASHVGALRDAHGAAVVVAD